MLDIFIEEKEFKNRLADDANVATYRTAYDADWETGDDGLACKAWLDDGAWLASGKQKNWPARGLKAKKGDYDAQRRIWWVIATKKVSVGSGRLWRPVKPLSKKLTLFFAPVNASTLFFSIADGLRRDHEERTEAFGAEKVQHAGLDGGRCSREES